MSGTEWVENRKDGATAMEIFQKIQRMRRRSVHAPVARASLLMVRRDTKLHIRLTPYALTDGDLLLIARVTESDLLPGDAYLQDDETVWTLES